MDIRPENVDEESGWMEGGFLFFHAITLTGPLDDTRLIRTPHSNLCGVYCGQRALVHFFIVTLE